MQHVSYIRPIFKVTLTNTDVTLHCTRPVQSRTWLTVPSIMNMTKVLRDIPNIEEKQRVDSNVVWKFNDNQIPFQFKALQSSIAEIIMMSNVTFNNTGRYTCEYKVPYIVYKAVSYLSVLGNTA